MRFDLSKSYECVRNVLAENMSLRAGMIRLIDYCEMQVPSKAWESIRALDFEADAVTLRRWLENVLSIEIPAQSIAAFWFGLINPVLGNGQTTCGLYISGTTTFDPGDETGDCFCLTGESYLPERRNADSQVLQETYRAVAGPDAAGIGEYVLCLGYACMAIRNACEEVGPKLLIGNRESRAVAVGFDSGDFILLGSIGRDGWQTLKAGH